MGATVENTLFTKNGVTFDSADGGVAGDDGWKEYAKTIDKVWYVGGSNVDDVFSVDFVTEPGLLQGHHLVTRLSNNNGNFTFDAQVRLDFTAVDEDGNLIWDPTEILVDFNALADTNPFARAAALDARFQDNDPTLLGSLLPPEDDFLAIVIDALGGNDQVTVGPTVQKTVWVDGGDGDDRIQILSGQAILPDQTDTGSRNDSIATAAEVGGPAVITAGSPLPANGLLTAAAQFSVIVDNEVSALVTVPASEADARSPSDLLADVNRALAVVGLANRVSALLIGNEVDGQKLAFATLSSGTNARLAISTSTSDPAATQLGLAEFAQATGGESIGRSTVLTGLTIDNPQDVDFYRVKFADPPAAGARIFTSSIAAEDGMRLALLRDDGSMEGELLAAETDGIAGIDLDGLGILAGQTYLLRVSSDLVPTIYNLHFDLADSLTPVGADLATATDFVRRDVLLGGRGDDILSGGPGEDWIFGGPGNDVLTGGNDRGASDLLFGEAGADTFQTIPDGLPLLKGTQQTFLPTYSDRFDGGPDDDRILFLGGDLDRRGLPVNDVVALRYNQVLGRYEVTSQIWDINNQRFITEAVDDTSTVRQFSRLYHFFTTTGVEQLMIDTREGDDVVHADPGYMFANDPLQETWGLAEGDFEAGAVLFNLNIQGGPGNDRLFGGAGNDVIDGGDGSDLIAGGLGDDTIRGGPSNDFLTGNRTIEPDRFEFVTRAGESGPNDVFQFAADLGSVFAGETIDGLSFHDGDQEDWYLVRPRSLFEFAGQNTAVLTPEMLRAQEVTIVDGQVMPVENSLFDVSLYMAESTGSGNELTLVPADVFHGAAEFVLIRVVRPASQQAGDSRLYQLEFQPPLGDTVDVSVESATHAPTDPDADRFGYSVDPNALRIKLDGLDIGGQGVVIPVGDIDGDTRDDFILSVRDAIPDPVTGKDYSYAKIIFGNDPLLDLGSGATAATDSVLLKLPAPILSEIGGARAQFSAPGDLDGDGLSDIVVSIEGTPDSDGVYIVFGRQQFNPVFDVVANVFAEGGNVVKISGVGTNVSAAIVGNVDDDANGRDDLVVSDDSGARLFVGRPFDQWLMGSSLALYHFTSGNDDGFTLVSNRQGTPPMWQVTGDRLVMGNGNYQYNVNDSLSTEQPAATAMATTPLIDLSGVLTATLKLQSQLQTENATGVDIARLQVEVNGETFDLATNQADGLLPDDNLVHDLTFDISQFAGQSIRIKFDFDTVDGWQNQFFGWAIDNVQIDAVGLSPDDADVELTNVASRATPLGDFDGDGINDLGVLTDSSFEVFFGQADVVSMASVALAGDFTGTTPFTAGRVNGDALPDAILSGESASTLVLSNGRSTPTTIVSSIGDLRSMGDLTGDGLSELVASGLETTARLEPPGENVHPVIRMFVGGSNAQLTERLEAGTPNVVFESTDSPFVDIADADSLLLTPLAVGPLGDVNSDGIADLGLFSQLSTELSVLFDGHLAETNDGTSSDPDATLPVERYPFSLATPIVNCAHSQSASRNQHRRGSTATNFRRFCPGGTKCE